MNINHLPQNVLEALRARGHSDNAIGYMSAEHMIEEYAIYNGMQGWGSVFYRLCKTVDRVVEG